MATKIKNLTVVAGDDNSLVIKFPDGSYVTDYDVFFTVKPYDSTTTDDSDAVFVSNSTDATFDTENNTLTVPISSSLIRLDVGTYKYDLQLKLIASEDIFTVLIGKYKVINDVTKRTV